MSPAITRDDLYVSEEEFAAWQRPRQQSYLKSLDARALLSKPAPPVPWVVEPLVARGCVTLFTGAEGEGKSMIAMALAGACLSGTAYVGDLRASQSQVLYVDAENGEQVIAERLHLLGVPPTIRLATAEGFSLSKHLELLEDQIVALQPGFVVLDSLRSLWPGGDENDSGSVERLLAQLRSLARRRNVGLLGLHHPSKQGNSPYRGSTAWGAGAEIVVTMRRDSDPAVRILEWRKCRLREQPRPMWLRFVSSGLQLRIESNVGAWETYDYH